MRVCGGVFRIGAKRNQVLVPGLCLLLGVAENTLGVALGHTCGPAPDPDASPDR